MHIEVDWQPDAAALTAIEENLQRVLGDVRRAVATGRGWWPRRGASRPSWSPAPRGLSGEQVAEAIDLLNWLATTTSRSSGTGGTG